MEGKLSDDLIPKTAADVEQEKQFRRKYSEKRRSGRDEEMVDAARE